MSRIDLDILTKDVYSKDELEEMANAINARYLPERLEKATPFDPYLFLDKLGYEYQWALISPGLQISAMTFFSNSRWYIWPKPSYEQGDVPEERFFKKGTVLVNECFLESKKTHYAEMFAVAHEGCHAIKDRRYFEEHSGEVASICKANDSKRVYWKKNMPTIELIERQNDYLTAAVIMPKDQVRTEFFKAIRWRNTPNEPIEFKPYMKRGIGALMKLYNIGFNAAKYRLQDIGVLIDPRPEVTDDD